MATEVGSDIALIQDEDMLRKMWQQTEDFGKKKEIRMRMYKLREQRLKEFYTTGEMIQTETTSKRSSTRTHTDSIADQGFLTMKSKEIRDSESPTDEYQRQSNHNKNDYVSSKNEISDGNNRITKIEQTSFTKPIEEFTNSSFQTSTSSSMESKWESSQTTISVSEEVQKVNVNSSSKFIEREQNNDVRQLTYDTSFNKQNNEDRNSLTYDSSFNKQSNEDNNYSTYDTSIINQSKEDRQLTYDNSYNQESSNTDSKMTELMTSTNTDSVNREDNSRYSNQKHIEVHTRKSNDDNLLESVSDNSLSKNKTIVDNTYTSNIIANKSENVEIKTDNETLNEFQKIDSHSSTQKSTTGSSTKPNEEKLKKIDNETIELSKQNTEGQYTTTYKDSYQQPRISVDLSPSHEAFARSLRSTPERSSPSPSRDRFSPERKLKSVSPEKYRASPEKSCSPPKSLRSSARRKLSSTYTKDISKKRANTPTRGEKHDSSDDSDCSAATHGTYDKYKSNSAKKTLFKEETKITSTLKYNKKSPSTSPVRREKSPGYSSEGSVGKELKKSSNKAKSSSHESSPERSAFKPVKNYRITQNQHETHNNENNLKLREENSNTNNYQSKTDTTKFNNFIKVIKPETIDNTDENNQLVIENTVNHDRDLKSRSVQEKFIIEEQVYNSADQTDNAKIIKESTKINREKSPLKELVQDTKLIQEKFIVNEKSKELKDNKKINEVLTVNLREKSPVKEAKPVTKNDKTFSTVKSTEKIIHSQNKNEISSKKQISSIPSSIKKPTSPEKTLKKNIVHKDSKDNLLHKTVKKDLSRDKIDTKITRNDSKTLMHKNSKESITSKTVVKKPSQEFFIDKKTTISYRNKANNSEIKPKTPELSKVMEKKDSKTKLKPSISPQNSQKKLGIVKSSSNTKSITENTNFKKIPSTVVTKPTTLTTGKFNTKESSYKGTKLCTTNTQSTINKNKNKETTTSNLNKSIKFEDTKNLELKSNDKIEDQLFPDNFESDSELDDSAKNPRYTKNNLSNSSSSSSSEDEAEEDKQKIKELDNIRIKAEEEYGQKMTNKDALLNISVQLPLSSRESSPEYSARFGRPYSSVSDDASLPRYADVVSEPEEVNEFKLDSNRYEVVTDLDEDTNVTVADRVSKFLHNVNKQEEIKTTEIPQSPQAVKKAKNLFESIAKGQIEENDINNEVNESETVSEFQDTSNVINSQSSLITRKISGASDYKTRKEFFEKRTTDDKKQNIGQEKEKSLTSSITRSSSIKDRQASFEKKSENKTPLKDKTNVSRSRSPESKISSPEKIAKSPTKDVKTEIFDVKVEEINKPRRLSGSKTVKDRTSCFEKNEVNQKSVKENKSTYKYQAPTSSVKIGRISDIYTKSAKISDSSLDHGSTKRVKSPNRSKKSPQKTIVDHSINNVSESKSRQVLAKSPERKVSKSPERNQTKSSEQNLYTNDENIGNRRVFDSTISSRQRTTTATIKSDYGATVKNASVPKTTLTTTKSTSANNADEDVSIEEIFDLHILEFMLEKAVGYDRRRRIRAQIRVVKRELELKNEKETTTTTTRVTKSTRKTSPVKTQKQSNVTVEKTEYAKKTETKDQIRRSSPQKSSVNLVNKSRSPSPQKTLRAVEETRSPITQKPVNDKARSPSPKKTTAAPMEKSRSPSPQKNTLADKARSPSPKKMSVAKKQQESRSNKIDSTFKNSSLTSSISKTVTATSKVKSEQVSTRVSQEQNGTDMITSSYGVGPTDDNGRPLFGLRALRKTNTNQSLTGNDSVQRQVDTSDSVQDDKNRQKSLRNENKGNRVGTSQESRTTTVHRETRVTEHRAGVDQLITDHKGKPLFGLRALQSIGKNDGESVYEDAYEPPVSPQLREIVLKHEKHAEESSKYETQTKQKPKAKFRDSFIYDTKDESSSTFQENGYSDPNSITLRSIIKSSEADTQKETTVKSKSQSTVFQSKSVMRSDGSGHVSVTRDFLKGEVSSVNDQEPSGKLIRGHYTYQSPDDSDAKKGIAKVTTVTTSIGGKNVSPEIMEITEEFNDSDRVDSNKAVKRSLTNGKFESIQKRFSTESFDQGSRRSSRDTNGYEKTDESVSVPRSSLVRGDSIKALQHKFQQATVSSSLKQSKSTKSESSSSSRRQTEEKTVTTKVNSSKSSGPTSFLDNSSRVTGVQDVLTRMRNADLVVEKGDTDEDTEARALLNKFLGASVILHGMEQGAKSPTSSPKAMTSTSASLVNQVEKQRAQKSPAIRKNLNEQELDNIWDEKQLQILLESSSDYDQRKKIRARIRQIMAEQKVVSEVTETKSTSTSNKTEGSSYVKTEVHTRTTTSSNRSSKANNDSTSPFAKFQQLERQNSAPNSQSRPCYKLTDAALTRSASSIKDRLLSWVKAQTKEYKNLQITNFSTSWSDGLAFCALIHHFYPEAFDYDKLKPENRKENFEIAFRVAEDEAGIAPLLDVEDMVVMRKPDWKCVFTYVQTFYRRFHNIPQTAKSSF